MGSCDLVGLSWLSSGFQESVQSCTAVGWDSRVLPQLRVMQKRIRHYVWDT